MRGSVAMYAWCLCGLAVTARAEITVSTDFESGSARVLAIDQASQNVRITPGGNPRRGWPNWWFFRVDGVDRSRPLTVEVVCVDAEVPNDSDQLRKLNPSWTLPFAAAVSADGKIWSQSNPGDRDGSVGRYRINATGGSVWLAWGPPYTSAHVGELSAMAEKNSALAKPFLLATSREGRAVRGVHIAEGDKPRSERPAVFITGRQHAWESGGSWVATGLAEWLLSDSAEAQWLRRNGEVFVVPLLDIDHVATGDGGKGAEPQDHNRDWSDRPHWPEVAAVQRRISELAAENRMAVFLDSHNPGAGASLQTFYVQYPPYCGEEAAAAQERFLSAARDEFGEIRILDGKPSVAEHLPIWKRIAAPWVCEHANRDTVSLTVETPWNTPNGTVAGYKTVGAKLGRATMHYLQSRAGTEPRR